MERAVISLLDDEPIAANYGSTFVTEPFRVPPGFQRADWYICGWHFVGQSAIRVTVQEECEPTSWRVLDHFDLYSDIIHTGAVREEIPGVVRARVEIMRERDLYGSGLNSAARLRLTVKLMLSP